VDNGSLGRTWSRSEGSLLRKSENAHANIGLSQDHNSQPTKPNWTKHTIGPRVLVAEDNVINVKVIEKVLKHVRPNINIDVVGNGIDVLKASKKNKYDLILMDIHMPGTTTNFLFVSFTTDTVGALV